jgi:hypothetical protein
MYMNCKKTFPVAAGDHSQEHRIQLNATIASTV